MTGSRAVNARVTIRASRAEDTAAIGRLGALMVKEHHDFDPLRFIAPTPETPAGYGRYLASQLNEPSVIVLVAEDAGEVVGYSYAGMEGYDYMALRAPSGALYDILVDPDHRRRGIGRMLLDATIAELRSRGAPRVVLSTAQRNAPAQALFEGIGFRRTMIEMTLELPNPDAA